MSLTYFGYLLNNSMGVLVYFVVGAQLQNRETNLSRNQGTYCRKRIDQKHFSIQTQTLQIFKLYPEISQRRYVNKIHT